MYLVHGKRIPELLRGCSGELLDEILTKLNCHLSSCSRSVVLLMDNAGFHHHELKGRDSNINNIFLTPNTLHIQPPDLGIQWNL